MIQISIHKIGQVVGLYVAKKISKIEQTEYLAYGAEIFIGSIFKVSILFSIAVIMDILLEVAVLLIVTGLIRTLSGGAHCSAYYRCLILSLLIFSFLGYIIKTIGPFIITLPTIVLFGIVLFSFNLYWFYAPQSPVNKPFKSKTIELTFRWYTLITVVILSIISIILGASNLISWVIAFALLWQAFTLTPVGHKFISLCDIFLNLESKGGETGC